MGKVKTVNPEEQEAQLKEKEAKEAARLAKIAEEKARGQANPKKDKEPKSESVISNASEKSPEEISRDARDDNAPETSEKSKVSKYAAKKAEQAKPGKGRSEKYLASAKMVDKSKQYSLKEALELVEKTHLATFDETVELHIDTLSTGVNGHVTLPHGTGKQTRVAVLSPAKDPKAADELLKEIEAGKINFDVLVATPDAMPRLAKVARVLGPKGLMPNPKNGTVTPKPEEVAAKYAGGQMHFKTEAKAPIIHLSVGKLSFGATKLSENIEAALKAVKAENIKKVFLKSTMSPSVRLQPSK